MADNLIENNQVKIIGEILHGFSFSHELYGEGFYNADIGIDRLSGSKDIIPVVVSDRLIDVAKDYTGCTVCIKGQYRSYNKHREGKSRLDLSVFAREIEFVNEIGETITNQIYLEGYICMEPVYRKTPKGRDITDIHLAVNRLYAKTDYIPCICWGKTARYAGSLPVGTKCMVWGRIQSREYMKKLPTGGFEKRVAYEVSISKIETEKTGDEAEG